MDPPDPETMAPQRNAAAPLPLTFTQKNASHPRLCCDAVARVRQVSLS
jgi:hypothetical protein